MSLVCRSDKQDGPDALRKLTEFYKQGDLLMQQMGNEAFDVIKLVDPHCTFQMSVTAHKNRPLIPVDSFRYHLSSALTTLSDDYSIDPDSFFNLIKDEESHRQTLLYYGSFRHWGHPFLDYEDGLRRLPHQVQMVKSINDQYAASLASDLAHLILEKEFFSQRKWFVDLNKMDPSNLLRSHVVNIA